jgi:hypothetical protein
MLEKRPFLGCFQVTALVWEKDQKTAKNKKVKTEKQKKHEKT